MSEPNKVSIEQLSRYINSKQELYESTLRNGYFLPKINSSIVTQDYLLQVISGQLWCPLYKDIRLLPCVRPPQKLVLLEKVADIAEKMKKPLGITESGQPDKAWLVSVLSTYSPRDEIFDKGYLPPPKPNAIKNLKLIELPTGFLKNLPHSKNTHRRNGLALVREGKMTAKKQKLSI